MFSRKYRLGPPLLTHIQYLSGRVARHDTGPLRSRPTSDAGFCWPDDAGVKRSPGSVRRGTLVIQHDGDYRKYAPRRAFCSSTTWKSIGRSPSKQRHQARDTFCGPCGSCAAVAPTDQASAHKLGTCNHTGCHSTSTVEPGYIGLRYNLIENSSERVPRLAPSLFRNYIPSYVTGHPPRINESQDLGRSGTKHALR
jgi:hypothetical protein